MSKVTESRSPLVVVGALLKRCQRRKQMQLTTKDGAVRRTGNVLGYHDNIRTSREQFAL